MRNMLIGAALVGLCGCSIQPLGDDRVVMTRPIRVAASAVQVFAANTQPSEPYSVMEEVWIKDDGTDDPDLMLDRLREKAGSIGANGLILAATNRTPNGTRIMLKPTLDNPFDYYAAQAIWVGKGGPRIKVLN